MNKLDRMAARDAANWARAEMFFGEGAGTRRKLLSAEIASKSDRIPGYMEVFDKWYAKQNFAEHAIKAAKERKSIDRSIKLKKNTRAIVRGDRRNLSTGLAILMTAGYLAHQTGYDVVLLEKGKRQYRKAQLWWADYTKPTDE